MNYDVDYFIDKFEHIPEDLWCTKNFKSEGKCCALGHCGYQGNEFSSAGFIATTEGQSLVHVFCQYGLLPTEVNDGRDPRYEQPTPKQRVLAVLYNIKADNHE